MVVSVPADGKGEGLLICPAVVDAVVVNWEVGVSLEEGLESTSGLGEN